MSDDSTQIRFFFLIGLAHFLSFVSSDWRQSYKSSIFSNLTLCSMYSASVSGQNVRQTGQTRKERDRPDHTGPLETRPDDNNLTQWCVSLSSYCITPHCPLGSPLKHTCKHTHLISPHSTSDFSFSFLSCLSAVEGANGTLRVRY